jgi:DNA mismatch repair protein MutS2
MKENERLKKEMERVMDREKHRQQVELLRQQNRVTEERIAWLKDTERKIKQIVFDWRRAERDEDKSALMRQLHALLFRQKEKQVKEKVRKKLDARYELASGEARPGDKVLMKQNNQVGTLSEIRGKKAIVQLGSMPLTVEYGDLALVREKDEK